MVTTTNDRAEVFSRPAARFDAEGNIEVRASAVRNCRRALWYAATDYEPTNPPSEESLTAMEAGNALEPVVVRAMERAGWRVDPADPQDPRQVAVRVGPNMIVSGHPDAIGRMPLEPVHNLFKSRAAKASTTICRLVFSFLSQFFQSRRHFSSQAKDRSTTHLFGSTTKVCSSSRRTISTVASSIRCTASAKGFPVYPASTSTFCTWPRSARWQSNMAKAPARSVTLAVVT